MVPAAVEAKTCAIVSSSNGLLTSDEKAAMDERGEWGGQVVCTTAANIFAQASRKAASQRTSEILNSGTVSEGEAILECSLDEARTSRTCSKSVEMAISTHGSKGTSDFLLSAFAALFQRA